MNQNRRTARAVIFDFDGVILESSEIKTEAFLDLFANHPEHQAAILDFHLANQGISRFVKFEWIYSELLRRPLDAAEKQRLGEAFSRLVLEKVLSCPFVPGALETLQQLRGRTLSFVASGTPQEELDLIVRERGLSDYFQGVWGSPVGKVEIIAMIRERHALERDEMIFVGDGISDYDAATAAGIPFVARDTPAIAADWDRLGISRRIADLAPLAGMIGLVPASAG